jgi:hypothetical protein
MAGRFHVRPSYGGPRKLDNALRLRWSGHQWEKELMEHGPVIFGAGNAHDHEAFSVRVQCALPGLIRSTLYCRPQRVLRDSETLMRRIDELHAAHINRAAGRWNSLRPSLSGLDEWVHLMPKTRHEPEYSDSMAL